MDESTSERFARWTAENGYTLADGFEWVNIRTRYAATCPAGHECMLRPDSSIGRGSGCQRCGILKRAETKTEGARQRFLAWINEAGFTLAEGFEWVGSKGGTAYDATCPQGHPCRVSPNAIQQGRSGCGKCARKRVGRYKTSVASRDEFTAWADANGYTLVDFKWRGTMTPHPAICPNGHECRPNPGHVRKGVGGCAACKNKVFDVFYVVTNPDAGVLKFGVTSGDPAPRLRDHRKHGYSEVVRLFRGMGQGEAATLERELLRLMACGSVPPVKGREYFPLTALNTVLYVADEWVTC